MGTMKLDVLIIDDSVVMRAVLAKLLRMTGIPLGTVHEAGNGAAGLALLERQRVDLVLLDISMPVMRGDEMLERLREQPALRELPVVVVSSESSNERRAHLEALGAVFVHKPFSPEQLRDVIVSASAVPR
jgi:two-component system, chemotaxis family, chemotaxis protein CheY